MAEFDGKLPILGMEQHKIRAGSPTFGFLVRSMDENGTFEPESTQLVNGQVQAIAGRSNICSAEDLVDMITDSVMAQRIELKKLVAELKS